jgi:hypothetical protein
MKKLFLLLLLVLLTACGPSLNAIRGEEAYYAAKVAMAQKASSQPIFEMLASDLAKPIVLENVSAIRVFQVPSGTANDNLQQYVQKDHAQPWINAFLQSLGIIAPWAGAAVIVSNVASSMKDLGSIPKSQTITNTNTSVAGTGHSTVVGSGSVVNATATPFVVNPVIVP